MSLKNWVFYAFWSLVVIIAIAQPALAIGVQPMVLDFLGSPGEQYAFEISISPEDTQRVVYLSLYQPFQNLDGSLSFVEGNSDVYPPIGWVRLEKERVVVPPGTPTLVTGTVTIPFGAGGSYSVLIMVEPAVEDMESGFAIIVRYAVRLTINVDRPGLRTELKVVGMDVIPDEEGKPILQVHVKNPSPFRFLLSGEATLRDMNRRLVERVTLKTPSDRESGYDSMVIYPETELLLASPIGEPLSKGTYHLQSFLSYDISKQVIKGREIQIEEGDFISVQDHYARVKPPAMDSAIHLGAATTHIVEVENRTAESLIVQISGEDIETDYARSVFKNLEVEIRGDQEFDVEPRRSGRTVLLIRAPRDVKPGGYYGKIIANVFSNEGEYLESHAIPLNVLVGKEWRSTTEVQSLVVEEVDSEYLFSLAFLNSGDAHLAPRAIVQLYNEQGEVVNNISLDLNEERKHVLPGMTGFLAASVPRRYVLPGVYNAIVTMFAGNEKVGTADFEVVIELEEDSHEEG